MNDEIRLSRLRVSRRRALSIGGTISLSGLIAACGGGAKDDGAAATAPETTATTATTGTTTAPASDGILAALDEAPSCVLATEETQGPYWFDVDSIRRDIREDRPGARLDLALRVQDMTECKAGGDPAPVADAVVEIWHCDAGGVYSGFESGAMGPPGGGGGGETSDGSYSEGVQEASPTDDGTFLRGAQVTDGDGVARFITIYPGWYRGRTVHIHLKVHIDKRNVLTTQLYFDEDVNEAVYATAPYDERTGRDTFNDGDGIFDASGMLATARTDDGYRAVLNLGINA
jgi:protocatechuate 3,4-dioxygenase beta subunit